MLYGNAVREVAKKLNIPLIDPHEKSLAEIKNLNAYLADRICAPLKEIMMQKVFHRTKYF